MLNINEGKNPDLMAACETLKSYSIFVSKVRQYIKDSKKSAKDKNSTIINCINRAIDDCITNNILKEFFLKYRKEVVEASMWDYNEELHYKTVAEVKYQDGFKGGVKNTNQLYVWLFNQGRDADVKRAASDQEFLDQLFKEFNSKSKQNK